MNFEVKEITNNTQSAPTVDTKPVENSVIKLPQIEENLPQEDEKNQEVDELPETAEQFQYQEEPKVKCAEKKKNNLFGHISNDRVEKINQNKTTSNLKTIAAGLMIAGLVAKLI